MSHDPLCENSHGTCCPWMGECTCQCTCERIQEIREDERRRIIRNRRNKKKHRGEPE